MLDFSWSELLVIMVVALVVIGPKDIPKIMYGLGRIARRVQYVKYALSQQFEDIMKEGDLRDLQKMAEEKSQNLPDTNEAEFDEHKEEGHDHESVHTTRH